MSTALVGGGPPPFSTSTSTPPKASIVRSTSSDRCWGLVRSPRTASAPMRSASRSRRSRRRANIATFAPSAASDSAIARPIPEDAPQTIAVRPRRPRSIPSAHGEDADDVADRGRRLLEPRSLLLGEVDLDDLLDAARADLRRHAHVEAVDPVLALEVRGARQHALLVEQH